MLCPGCGIPEGTAQRRRMSRRRRARRKQAQDAAAIKADEAEGSVSHLTCNQSGDQIARYHEKDIDAYESAWKQARECVVDHDEQDRHRPHAVDICSVRQRDMSGFRSGLLWPFQHVYDISPGSTNLAKPSIELFFCPRRGDVHAPCIPRTERHCRSRQKMTGIRGVFRWACRDTAH